LLKPDIQKFTHGLVGWLEERAALPLLDGTGSLALGFGLRRVDPNRLQLPLGRGGIIDPNADSPVRLAARARPLFL